MPEAHFGAKPISFSVKYETLNRIFVDTAAFIALCYLTFDVQKILSAQSITLQWVIGILRLSKIDSGVLDGQLKF